VCGRIDAVRPVADILADIKREFFEVIEAMHKQYVR
jgi:hypothetical protein